MTDKLITALVVVLGVPGVLVTYIWLTEQFLRLFSERLKPRVRPWLWLGPAFGFLGFFLVYPTIGTIIRSLQDKLGKAWVGLDNFAWFFGSDDASSALACWWRSSSIGSAMSRLPRA
jgi:alpha-glucoside transport system permease protein